MPIRTSLKDPKTRMSIGMLCLAIGNIFPYFVHPATAFGINAVHAVRGMLSGFSIVLLIAGASRFRSPAQAIEKR